MKRFFMAIAAVILTAPAFAQFSSGGFELDKQNLYYGARIGFTSAGINGTHMDNKIGMTLGGVIGLRCSDNTPVFLESGLYYTERGAKKGKHKVNLSYLEVPVLIKYGIKASDDIAILPYIGPYFALGIAGKTKYNDDGVKKSFSSFDEFKRADVGFKRGCGVEYNKLYLEAGYQIGVTNIAKNDDEFSAHNRAFFMNFGINF